MFCLAFFEALPDVSEVIVVSEALAFSGYVWLFGRRWQVFLGARVLPYSQGHLDDFAVRYDALLLEGFEDFLLLGSRRFRLRLDFGIEKGGIRRLVGVGPKVVTPNLEGVPLVVGIVCSDESIFSTRYPGLGTVLVVAMRSGVLAVAVVFGTVGGGALRESLVDVEVISSSSLLEQFMELLALHEDVTHDLFDGLDLTVFR